jgi:glycosyltransferase involved in cell wall biosynthesis
MVIRNEEKALPSLLKYVKPITDEFMIFDQDSTDRTPRILSDVGARVVPRTAKGLADIDRQDCYTLATSDLVLALDADEKPDKRLMKYIKSLKDTAELPYDVWWFFFRNVIDGIDCSEKMPHDWHPRLWARADNRPPVIIWPGEAHTYPQIQSHRQLFCTAGKIDHVRTLAKIQTVHDERGPVIDPQNRQLEENWQEMVTEFVNTKKGRKR